jgi:membrane protein implicated in regulation of membrane protease activity
VTTPPLGRTLTSSVGTDMDLESPDTWRWIWLAVTALLAVAEAVTPIAFGFLPMALAAAVACVLAFAGVSLGVEWLAFVGSAVAAYALLLPVGTRIARGRGGSSAVGADRWVGRQAHVLETIPTHGTGLVRLDREQWRAESGTNTAIPAGSIVLVTRLDGTRLEVVPLELAPPQLEE